MEFSKAHYSTAAMGSFLRECEEWEPHHADRFEHHVEACTLCCYRLEKLSRDQPCDLPDPTLLPDRYQLPNTPQWTKGGQAIVFRASHVELEHEVALKIMNPTPEGFEGLQRESRILARVHHPNIVHVYDFFVWDGFPCLVMEYMPNGSLTEKIKAKRPGVHEAVAMVIDLARAIEFVHQRTKILHRDLKPGNILFDHHDTPRVADYGLAWRPEDHHDDSPFAGTPSYMAPEQARGEVEKIDQKTDVYGLSAILFALLSGKPPLQAKSRHEILNAVVQSQVLPLPTNVSGDLAAICHKGLADEPSHRYDSANDFADDLERFLRGEPVHARPPWLGRRLLMWARRQPAVAAFVGLLVLSMMGLTGWVYREQVLREQAELRAERQRRLRVAVTDSLKETVISLPPGLSATTARLKILDGVDRVVEQLNTPRAASDSVQLELAAAYTRWMLTHEQGKHDEAAEGMRQLLARIKSEPTLDRINELRLAAYFGLIAAELKRRDFPAIEEAIDESISWTKDYLTQTSPSTNYFFYWALAQAVNEAIRPELSAGKTQNALDLLNKFLALPESPALADFPSARKRAELLLERARLQQVVHFPAAETDLEAAHSLAESWRNRRPNDLQTQELLWRVYLGSGNIFAETDPKKAEEWYERARAIALNDFALRWPADAIMAEVYKLQKTPQSAHMHDTLRILRHLEVEVLDDPTLFNVSVLFLAYGSLRIQAILTGDRLSARLWDQREEAILRDPPGGIVIPPKYREYAKSADAGADEVAKSLDCLALRAVEVLPRPKELPIPGNSWPELLFRAKQYLLVSQIQFSWHQGAFRNASLTCLEAAVLCGFRDEKFFQTDDFTAIREDLRFQAILNNIRELNKVSTK